MNRDEAHSAIMLILSSAPADYKFTDQADDILDAIGWGVTANDALDALWETFETVRNDRNRYLQVLIQHGLYKDPADA